MQILGFTLVLLGYHLLLQRKNLTTYEKVKHLMTKLDSSPNPFDRGNIFLNMAAKVRQFLRSDTVLARLIEIEGGVASRKRQAQVNPVKLSQVVSEPNVVMLDKNNSQSCCE